MSETRHVLSVGGCAHGLSCKFSFVTAAPKGEEGRSWKMQDGDPGKRSSQGPGSVLQGLKLVSGQRTTSWGTAESGL